MHRPKLAPRRYLCKREGCRCLITLLEAVAVKHQQCDWEDS